MSSQLMLPLSLTFLQGSEGGHTRLGLQDGQTDNRSGQPLSPASRFQQQERGSGQTTIGTSGQSFESLSRSASLQLSLESRLRPQLAGLGSDLYALTWKHWDIPLGPPICALRASGLRISANAYSGEPLSWPTPTALEFEIRDVARMLERRENLKKKGINGNGFGFTLGQLVTATAYGWSTPVARDWKDGPFCKNASIRGNLGRQVWVHGDLPDWCCAPTDEQGRLHPSHVGWMMGYPIEWDSCGVMGMQLSRK